jgi:hypothetical protein
VGWVSNLTPLIPLSLERRGGWEVREGLRPSLQCTPISLLREGGKRQAKQ